MLHGIENFMNISISIGYLTLSTVALMTFWVIYSNIINIPIFSPALGYWAGWITVSSFSWYCEFEGWLYFDPDFLGFILFSHFGALFGIITADIFSTLSTRDLRNQHIISDIKIFETYQTAILVVLFSVGTLLLFEQISRSGFSSEYLSVAREQHLMREDSLVRRIGSQLSVIANVVAIIFGVNDAVKGVKIRRIAILLLASAPLGLSSASRIFLMNYTLFYLISLMSFRSMNTKFLSILTSGEVGKLLFIFCFSAAIFSFLGFIRGGYGHEFSMLYNIMIWPSSTLGAIDEWIREAIVAQPANGYLTLGYFSDTMIQLGINPLAWSRQSLDVAQDYFLSTRNSALYIPRSYVPDLIFDFGPTYYVAGSYLLLFSLQFTFRRLSRGHIYSHALSVVLVYAAFMTIQNPPFSPWAIATVFWSFILGAVLQRMRARLKYQG